MSEELIGELIDGATAHALALAPRAGLAAGGADHARPAHPGGRAAAERGRGDRRRRRRRRGQDDDLRGSAGRLPQEQHAPGELRHDHPRPRAGRAEHDPQPPAGEADVGRGPAGAPRASQSAGRGPARARHPVGLAGRQDGHPQARPDCSRSSSPSGCWWRFRRRSAAPPRPSCCEALAPLKANGSPSPTPRRPTRSASPWRPPAGSIWRPSTCSTAARSGGWRLTRLDPGSLAAMVLP